MSVTTWMIGTLRSAGATLLTAASAFLSENDAPETGLPAGKRVGLLGFDKDAPEPSTQRERRIAIRARAFEFDPAEIGVPLGVPIRFVVASEDMYHTYTVKRTREAPDILLNIKVPAKQTAEGVYTFEDPGEYYVYCIPHERMGMTGVIRASDVGGPSEP